MEIELENVQPNIAVLYCADEDFCMQMQREKNNRHGKVIIAKDPEEILLLAKKPNVKCVALELPPLAIPLGHKENIFLM
jgi:hypothetical protein